MRKLVYLMLVTVVSISVTSCVTSNKYNDLLSRKVRLESEKAECGEKLTKVQEEYDQLEKEHKKLNGDYSSLNDEFEQVSRVLKRIKTEYNNLEDLHDRLTAKYNELMKLGNIRTNQLSTDLSVKQQELFLSEKKLSEEKAANDKLSDELKTREARVKELEQILAQQQKAVEDLKSKVSSALNGFSASELKIEHRDGKVYVSLAEQLLFKSGSIKVDKKGQDALAKLARVLATQSDLNIVVEGHTDDVPISKTSTYMKDNWDLSVLRATEIVRILTSNGVGLKKIQAAGRGPNMPLNPAKSTSARSQNRRTEIILTPNLDELFKMLGQQEE